MLSAHSIASAQSSPAPVLAYYYAWWAPQAVGPGKSPDWPVTPYHSWDPAVIQQHVAQAAGAGIDGLVVAWYGPQEENNQTETNFRMILDQAAANGISALLSVDLGSAAWFQNTREVIDGLNYALTVHARHPAYFRYNGRPVLVFWYQGRYSLSDWAAIRQQVDPDHASIWIAEGAALDALPTFDGLHMYTISWSQNVYGTLAQWGDSTRARGGIWMATAMPGWDNTYTQQSEKYIRERQDGAFYRDTFAAAAASAPDLIVITSWNEWWEGTHIEPSHLYGDFYLNLTRDLIGEYRASGAVAGSGGALPPVAAAASPEARTPSLPASTGAAPAAPSSEPSATTTPLPAPLLPPTITPTFTALPAQPIAAVVTPAPAATEVAAIEVGREAPARQSPVAEALARPGDRLAAAAGVLVGLAGLGMIVGVLIAYLRTRAGGPDRPG